MFWANIVWPVWRLRAYSRLYTVDKITYIDSFFRSSSILDNKNITGNFVTRRLQIPKDTRYELNEFYISLDDLMRLGKGTFIDSSGLVFTMKKSNFAKITAHKLDGIDKVGDFTYFIKVKGITQPITYETLEPLEQENYTWAYLIYSNRSWLVYSFLKSEPLTKKLRRKLA